MNATIPQILRNMITNAKEIAQSRDATEDIAEAAAAIIDEATELLERWEGKPEMYAGTYRVKSSATIKELDLSRD